MATTAGAKKGLWSTIRRIAASDRISGLIMLGFALTGLVLANLPATAHAFETVAETHLFIPYTNLDLPIGHWAQDGLLTIFFLTVGLELKQELTTGSLANPKAAAVPMLCAVGGMIAPPILFLAVTALFSQIGPGEPGTLILTTTGSSIPFSEMSHGWAVPTATDIAFSLAVLALFAKALPGSIRAFLMTLATVDDLLAIILIAVFFSSINAWYWFIGIAVCAAIWAYLVRLKKVPWIAVGIVGILAWIMMFEAGVHPTLAGGKSVGLGIELPHEQGLNQWVNLGMSFRYFFVRKTMFIKYSSGVIVCPGGFGTLDEMFELLTLVQTHKVANIPVVLYGKEYWQGLFDWLNGPVAEHGMISTIDPKLVTVTDDADEAVDVAVSAIVR